MNFVSSAKMPTDETLKHFLKKRKRFNLINVFSGSVGRCSEGVACQAGVELGGSQNVDRTTGKRSVLHRRATLSQS